ncbi:SusC/RagA family TonB-linked outer membrane protein [Parafilimonas sp.]|uniref:SusC/RagA family TonB-linked outer membrane protein n=1 Tax=Parafilimonas sp. TaxID=1969739 RepID=UPI0039E2E531
MKSKLFFRKAFIALCFMNSIFIRVHAFDTGNSPGTAYAKHKPLPATQGNYARPAIIKIAGKVTDSTGNPLTGVSVQVKNKSGGTITDAEGNFEIDAPDNAVLVFNYVGYRPKEISVTGTSFLTVVLEQDMGNLNEVLVTGYTQQRKKDLTGAVSVVNVEDMTKQPIGLVTNQLQGQASGVTVIQSGQPGEEPQIRIRGINTFGNNVPLYVVDGIPTQDISNLNPNDVASMQVLKDAGAASIYGSRASNGIIIITTKKGTGKLTVNYSGYYGRQIPRKGNVLDLLTPQEQANYNWEAQKNNGVENPSDPLFGSGPTPVLPDYIAPLGASEGDPSVDPSLYYVNPNYTSVDDYNSFYRIVKANKQGTDWYHEVFKPAPVTSHDLSVSGSGDKISYFGSFNYFDQHGTLLNTYLKRYTIRSNVVFNITKGIKVGENLAYAISHNPNRINVVNQYAGTSPIFFAVQIPSLIPVYDIKGNYAGTYGTAYTAPNPVAVLQRSARNKQTTNRLFGNVYADVTFLKSFTFHTSFGGENVSGSANSFQYPTYENAQNQTNNVYYQSANTSNSWTWTNTLTFNKVFAEVHDVKVMVGTEAYKSKYDYMSASTQGYFSFNPDFVTLTSGSGTRTNDGGKGQESLSSEFARLDYSFKDRYLISGTIRRDGSSKFVNEKYGWFPAVSAGWRLSQEKFMSDISWIQDLKIRGSWGIMGNQLNVNADNAFYTYISSNVATYYDIGNTNNTLSPGFQVGQIGNPDARWEKDINANIGIDVSLFAGRLSVTADYYKKDISGLLYNPALLGTQGAGTAPYVNIAQTTNQGFDATLSGYTNITKDIKLDASVNFTTYKNRIEKVTDNTNYFWTADKRQFGDFFIRNEVGHPIGSFYGYKIVGFWNSEAEVEAADEEAQKATGDPTVVYQSSERVGFFRYEDVNKDGQITTDDRTFIGNPNPKFTYGINLNFTYKNFDLGLFFYGVQGNKVWNNLLAYTDLSGITKASLYDHWTEENHNAKTPLPGTYASYQGTPNSYFVENGSYLKLKNVQLGYSFSPSMLSKAGMESLRIYVQSVNLFTITPYSGIDPEISGSVTDFGVDHGIYPTERQFLFGINVKF